MSEADAASPDLEVVIEVRDIRLEHGLIAVVAPPGTTTAVLPAPPSDVAVAALLEDSALGQIVLCEPDPVRHSCARYAYSDLFDVVP